MWVLIVLYFSGGNPSIAMHDFNNQQACQAAVAQVQSMEKDLKGFPQIRATCVSKDKP